MSSTSTAAAASPDASTPTVALASTDTPDTNATNATSDLINSLEVPIPTADLRDVEFSRLKAVLSQLKAGLDASSQTLVQLRRTARKQPAPIRDRSQFDFAYAQVRACEVALRTSIEQASNASAESAAALQAKVAENYEAYARAVTVAQSVAKNFLADNSSGHR